MMQSYDSFGSSESLVLPYLRAYPNTSNSSVRDELMDPGQSNSARGERGGTLALRTLVALAVFVAFAAAVSTSDSRWIVIDTDAGATAAAADPLPQQRNGRSYRGEFEAFEKNSSGGNLSVGERELPGGGISLVASNEYGEYDRRALALYGLEMVIEPFRETGIAIQTPAVAPSMRFHWLLVRADSSGAPLEGAEPVVNRVGGSFVTVTLTEPGEKYALLVREVGLDGSVLTGRERGGRTTISCKYVRRELRDLTQEDRSRFFSAMREFYTVTREDGRAKYGERFHGAKYLAAYHAAKEYCYNNGMQFLNAHAAFGLWAEQNLQMIDPKVSLPQWDFMVDAGQLGTNWGASEIFGPDMFGSALGSPDNQFQISDGWFANITSIHDPLGEFLRPGEDVSPSHNAYGFIDAERNYQAVQGVLRTSSFCGLEGEAEFTRCDVFIECFQSGSLHEWSKCMETEVHASMSSLIGGGFDCSVDMDFFMEENPQFTRGLLTFALEFLVAKSWQTGQVMEDYRECDTHCNLGQTEPCGCTCLTDPFSWTDQEVYDLMSSYMSMMTERSQGRKFVVKDEEAEYPFGFAQDGVRLDDESSLLLMRQLMMIACQPGKVGAMGTRSSPLDPIFWVLYTGFEKANHVLRLSPGYRDTYDFMWEDSDCGDGVSGGKLTDSYPFTERMLGFGEGSELLTNADIQELLLPSNPKVPYLYEGFDKWGTCTEWDSCPECSAAVSSRPE